MRSRRPCSGAFAKHLTSCAQVPAQGSHAFSALLPYGNLAGLPAHPGQTCGPSAGEGPSGHRARPFLPGDRFAPCPLDRGRRTAHAANGACWPPNLCRVLTGPGKPGGAMRLAPSATPFLTGTGKPGARLSVGPPRHPAFGRSRGTGKHILARLRPYRLCLRKTFTRNGRIQMCNSILHRTHFRVYCLSALAVSTAASPKT